MTYYNDFESTACAWLRELIAERLISPGTVDQRSIADVKPDDVRGNSRVHFFAGIGGWDYALELAGWPVELPVWTGSCPCQPLSCAGKRGGEKDQRHMWPEFYRLISECRPGVVFGEQVASGDGLEWIDGICLDLEELGYAVGASDIPAAGVRAPDIRQRLYWVACREGAEVRTRHGEVRPRPLAQGSNGFRDGDSPHGVVNPNSSGRAQRLGDLSDVPGHPAPECTSEDGIVGNPEGSDWQVLLRERRQNQAVYESGRPGGAIGLEHAPRDGRQQRRAEPSWRGIGGGCGFAHWDSYDLAARRNARTGNPEWCRIEPGTFPLAPRLPGRVGTLRGYGNAIVPQVAATFILAFLETQGIFA